MHDTGFDIYKGGEEDGENLGRQEWVIKRYEDGINVKAFLPWPLSTCMSVFLIEVPDWLKVTKTFWKWG